ncbi:acetyl-CoA carboxylase biotin carboxyl carrier protein subunit [Kitasatospora sp. NBC_01287]|uniref:acetyl-CoA carboxylase biotin carboxyl carrier protein n=1 Tax=Kitasatospora sp. NBC_01287 TaxID=2903573 RepID=UPI002257FD30|nr:biotin/lipoyl-containing protein [Kitasatospora sp. NBC_01287]MCX4744163.1 acetyl-CoA carboxylase biotin carboxyl carrier protein subunit [Kitasatospora sp. NBC_01287]
MRPERAEWERREFHRREEDRNEAGHGEDERAQPASGAVLDAVCRNVARLAKAAPTPPRRISVRDGQASVEIEWPEAAGQAGPAPLVGAAAPADGPSGGPTGEEQDALDYVRAPMVGTFYHAGSPEAAPFVRIGDLVRPGQPVGVLEAMKMMSTITAAVGGRVVEVIAPNAHPVEFDQRLIALEPVGAGEHPDDAAAAAG